MLNKSLKLLVVDDEPTIRYSIRQVLPNERIVVLEAATAEEALRLAAEQSPDVILLDIRLGKQSGLDVFHELKGIDPKCLVIFITGHGTTDTAIEAMKIGAYDYLVKPLDATQLQQILEQAFSISRMMRVPALLDEGDRPQDRPDLLIGSGPAMQSVCKQIGRVAPQNVNVLVLGESGTGKELVARAIYHHSGRCRAPFLAINCSAIPESLLESELFGHERGSFTGAERQRIGKFEQCHQGTLFLDEVGDMAASTQSKILRLLQEGRFERVGGNETITVDVRVIAATNQNLEGLIEEGRFRKDLYYRLRGVTIHLPPLRERREDISELAHYFLFRYNREIGTAVQLISPAALELMQNYDWPGNVRELQSIVREALIVSAGSTILPEFLPADVRRGLPASSDSSRDAVDLENLLNAAEAWMAAGETDIYRRGLETFDRLMIRRAMDHSDGNQARAAELLGLSRVTLRAKLRSLGMHVGKVLTEHSAGDPN